MVTFPTRAASEVSALTNAHVTRNAMAVMLREADDRYPNETGGVLLGWTLNGAHYVLDAVGPGPNATHAPTGFDPDSDWQEQAIAEAYARSGRRVTYLGDWHTHPRGAPRPRRLDRATMRAIAGHEAARCPEPFMLIVAGEPGHWKPALFQRRAGIGPRGGRTVKVNHALVH